MVCSSCGQENPSTNRFCGMCGTPLPQRPLTAPGAQSTVGFTRVPVEPAGPAEKRAYLTEGDRAINRRPEDQDQHQCRNPRARLKPPPSAARKSGLLIEMPTAPDARGAKSPAQVEPGNPEPGAHSAKASRSGKTVSKTPPDPACGAVYCRNSSIATASLTARLN